MAGQLFKLMIERLLKYTVIDVIAAKTTKHLLSTTELISYSRRRCSSRENR